MTSSLAVNEAISLLQLRGCYLTALAYLERIRRALTFDVRFSEAGFEILE